MVVNHDMVINFHLASKEKHLCRRIETELSDKQGRLCNDIEEWCSTLCLPVSLLQIVHLSSVETFSNKWPIFNMRFLFQQLQIKQSYAH